MVQMTFTRVCCCAVNNIERVLSMAPTNAILLALLAALLPSSVSATSLGDAGSIRDQFFLGDTTQTSYDGPNYDSFAPFSGFTSGGFLQYSSLNGGAQGTTLQFFLLSEAAYYDGAVLPGSANSFGFLDGNNNFNSVIAGTDVLGTMAEVNLGAGEQLTFALDSPEGLFSSIDSDNADNAAHMLGLTAIKDGQISIPNANLQGGMLTFNLLAGDHILFIEDLLASGNLLQGGLPSDFDYNDMVVIIREQPVPEPATYAMMILALTMLYFAKRREAMS